MAVPATAWASRAVVVLPFAGPRGEDTTERLASGLRGIQRVSAAKYMVASGRVGAEKAAKTLGVTAVVRGAITRLQGRWAVRVVVRTPDGSLVGRQVFPLRGTRVDRTTMRRLTQAVSRMVKARSARAKSQTKRRRKPVAPAAATPVRSKPVPTTTPAPTETPKPPPVQTGFDDGSDYGTDTVIVGEDVDDSETARRHRQLRNQGGLGFAVSGGGSPRTTSPETRTSPSPRASRARDTRNTRDTKTAQTKRSKPQDGTRQPWQPIVEAALGLALFSRSFAFKPATGTPPSYTTPSVIPAIAIDLAVYPMAAMDTPGLSDLGIAGRFQRTVGLKSSSPGTGELANTIMQVYEIGLTYRWNLLGRIKSPGLRFNLDFGQQLIAIDAPSGTTSRLPDITYTYFKPRIAIEWLFFDDSNIRLGLSAGGSFLVVLSAGDIAKNNASGFGDASVLAFDAGMGFRASYRGFFANLSGFYRRFALEFSGCQEACREAAGATDAYLGGLLTLGYAY